MTQTPGIRDPFGTQAAKAAKAAQAANAAAGGAKLIPSTKTTSLDPPDPNNGIIGPIPLLKKGKSLLDAPDRNPRNPGAILRYPYEALTDETDYLQIDIRKYDSVATLSGGLTSGGPQRRINQQSTGINPTFGRGAIDATQDRYTSLEGNEDQLTLSSSGKNKFKSAEGSILLPMPSNIQDGNSVSFASGNLDGVTSQVFGLVKDIVSNPAGAGGKNPISKILTDLTTKTTQGAIGLLGEPAFQKAIMTDLQTQAANIPLGGSLTRDAVFARTNGEILNQNVELLFNGVTLRSFKFSFKFTPRGPKEAQQVGLIINTFKRNMAAKVGQDANFLGTPNVFELTYKRGANSHPFLHSFKQCVLTDMSVNYTGEGTYAVYDDSTPVSMVLELGFKELEPIYDADYGSEPGVGY